MFLWGTNQPYIQNGADALQNVYVHLNLKVNNYEYAHNKMDNYLSSGSHITNNWVALKSSLVLTCTSWTDEAAVPTAAILNFWRLFLAGLFFFNSQIW